MTLEDAALELELAAARYDAALARVDRMLRPRRSRRSCSRARRSCSIAPVDAEAAAAARQEARTAIAALPEGKRQQPRTRELEQQLNDAELAAASGPGRSPR